MVNHAKNVIYQSVIYQRGNNYCEGVCVRTYDMNIATIEEVLHENYHNTQISPSSCLCGIKLCLKVLIFGRKMPNMCFVSVPLNCTSTL